ncbi:MAG: putative lipid II flippase FtsW [Actinobacteria bacterium]|nr:putative lipid II flippase FtsW [Actinomycetota bacterium]
MTTVPIGLARATAKTKTPVLQRPLASYYLVLASTGALLALGLVMVFSASSVRAYATYDKSYAIALKQAIFMAVGLPCMWAASRLPIRVWRMLGYPMLLAALTGLVLVLVPGIGRGVDGATRWIPLPGGFNIQPSELGKLSLALWGADLLVRKKKLLGDWKHLFVPLVPVACLVCLLVMLEPDMGTTLATISVVVALLWVVGTPLRYFAVFLGTLVSLATVLAIAEPYRMARLTAFLHPFEDAQGAGYQAVQGLYALSSGGWFGLGLGASREKWAGGLPNAHTDFVFAIIGEELGLLGTLSVLVLFGTLTYAGVRIAKRSTDPFARLAASAVTAWLAAQSLINIGAVVGMVPITGIPLPLVSFGGSALIPTLVAIGMLLSFARNEPGAAQALGARKKRAAPAPAASRTTVRGTGRTASRRPSPRRG